jgi:hypothetical protein
MIRVYTCGVSDVCLSCTHVLSLLTSLLQTPQLTLQNIIQIAVNPPGFLLWSHHLYPPVPLVGGIVPRFGTF